MSPAVPLALNEVFREAGFPDNLFRTLLIGSNQVDAVIAHPLVRAVTLTGSTPAGKAVAKKAGEMLKKTVLELGGSDAYVVLADADLDAAVATCVASRLINAGQSCIAAKRFIMPEAIHQQFAEGICGAHACDQSGRPVEEKHANGAAGASGLTGRTPPAGANKALLTGPPVSLVASFPRVKAPFTRRPY